MHYTVTRGIDHWSNIIDNGNNIDVIYLDFKKAFDTMSHIKLIKKMETYTINKKNINQIGTGISVRARTKGSARKKQTCMEKN